MRYLLLLCLLSLFTACAKQLTPFNQDLYDKYRWSNEELKNIQFYLSDDIVLYKKLDGSEASISDGKIQIKKEKKGEKILMKRGTPGVYIFSPKNNRFAISFHESDDTKYLMFGPNEALKGNFALLGKEWGKYQGQVTYEDQTYIVNADDALAILLVDLRKVSKYNYQNKEERGRKIK
jgi:hypothetical protein